MLSTLKSQLFQHKKMLIAILASLFLHTVFLSNLSFTLPTFSPETRTIELVINNSPVSESSPIAQKEQHLQKEENERINTEVPSKAPTPAPANKSILDDYASSPLPEPIQDIPTTAAADTALPQPSISLPLDSDIQTPPFVFTEIKTAFEVFRNNEKNAAGKAQITFSINPDNTYSINSTTEATGLVSLFFKELLQTSTGTMMQDGLKPSSFRYQYGDKKLQLATFNWLENTLTTHSDKGEKTEALKLGTQDLLSFMYQFMFTPPLETMQITMTNGKNLRTYTYSFEGEDVITTKLGELRSVHLLKRGEDEEKTELWLAIDYQYLPIKIRKTEKNGDIIEQIATSITTNPPYTPPTENVIW